MNQDGRHPWRTRVFLAGLFDVVAGGVVAVTAYLGVTEGASWAAYTSAVVSSALALAVTIGVIMDGEGQTTPVDTPVGRDGWALVSVRDLPTEPDADH